MKVEFADISKVIEEEISPYLVSHGGGIKLVAVDDDRVKVELMGGCRGCPGARMTVKGFVERVLVEKFPSVIVEDVTPF